MNFDEMTKEELIAYINNMTEDKTGKYGLVWDKEKEPEQIVVDCDKYIPILNEIKEKNINNDGQENILIEGDNFHALSVLNYTHKECIDVIYIDPPYNTGNKDFVYNDQYVDSEDGYRHSKWLNFMEKRLKLAKKLLKDDGMIFISIDDNELYQLKLLCDKIFGENNFISNIVVESGEVFGTKATHADKTFVKVKDYVLLYSKNKIMMERKKILYDSMSEMFDSHYNTIVDFSTNKKINLIEYLKNNDKISNIFKLLNKNISYTSINELIRYNEEFKKIFYDDIAEILFTDQPLTKKINEEFINRMETGLVYNFEDKLIFKTSSGSIRMLQSYKNCLHHTDDYLSDYCRSTIRGDLWKNFHLDMRNIDDEGGVKFKNGKKPVRLIKQLIKWANKPNGIILDFFAGSGSTGQAVLELNNEDNGNRKFILCTNNENSICEEITYPRLRNVIKDYDNKDGLNGTLKYYRTDFVDNSNNRDQLYYNLTERCIPMLSMKESCFKKIKSTKEYIIFSNKDESKYTCVYFDLFGELENEFIEKLKNISASKVIYKFSLGDYIDESIFEGVENYTIEAIPYRIVEVYRKLVKLSKEEN